MSFDTIDTNTDKILKDFSIQPTLVIGLGGSGKKTIINLRKQFLEKYGCKSLPIVDFLYMDTDKNEITRDDEAYFRLDKKDTVDTSIEPSEFDRLMANFHDFYPHIASWFDAKTVAAACAGGVTSGAKKIRSLGRLSFFLKFPEFKEKLRNKLTGITQMGAIEDTRKLFLEKGVELNVSDTLNIIVVGSLAGGTGSGMFIDIAFAVKALTSKFVPGKKPFLTGIFCLPGAFKGLNSDETDKAYANGYAALKELDYYLTIFNEGNTDASSKISEGYFQNFEWEKGQIEKVATPAFHVTYLIDDINAKGKSVGGLQGLEDVYRMISEFIFLDYNESTFGNKKRSLHSNFHVNLGAKEKYEYQESGYVDYFPTRYSTFGLSQIKFGVDKIRRAASYRLIADMINVLTTSKTVAPEWFNETQWGSFELSDRSIIDYTSSDHRSSLLNYWLQGTVDQLGNKIRGITVIQKEVSELNITGYGDDNCRIFLESKIDDLNTLLRSWSDHIRKEVLSTSVGVTAVTQSDILNRVGKIESDILSKCDSHINALLSDFERYGISYAEDFIIRLQNKLDRLKEFFEGFINTNPVMPDLLSRDVCKGIDDDLFKTLKRNNEEALNLTALPLFKNYAVRTTTERLNSVEREHKQAMVDNVTALFNAKQSEVDTFIRDSILRLISDKMVKVFDRLKVYYSEKKANLENFRFGLSQKVESFNAMFMQYSKVDAQERNVELSFDWDETEYRQQIALFNGGTSYDQFISGRVSDFVLNADNALGKSNPLFDLAAKCDSVGNTEQKTALFIQKFEAYAFEQLGQFKPKGNIDSAIKLFNETYGGDRSMYERKIKSLVEFASPRAFFVDSSRRPNIQLLGCDTTEKEFIDVVAKEDHSFDVQQFSNDEVIFYKEIIGYHAAALYDLPAMKQAFNKIVSSNPDEYILRHTDMRYDKFKDLDEPGSTDAHERVASFEPFIMGLLTGKVVFEDMFFIVREDVAGRAIRKPLKYDLNASINALNQDDRDYLKRNCLPPDGKMFIENKDGSLYTHVYTVLDELLHFEFNGEQNRKPSTMLRNAIGSLRKKAIHSTINRMNLPIDPAAFWEIMENQKEESATHLRDHFDLLRSELTQYRLALSSFSKDTGYFIPELNKNLIVLSK